MGEKRERDKADMWARRHVVATSAKPPAKTVGWSKMNGFKSWMVEDSWFCGSMAKTKLG
jgi:hypothetical protein